MTVIQAVATETLKQAQQEIASARRRLFLAAVLFALIHLLTVAPYLDAARRMQELKPAIAANAELLAELEPEITRLRNAEESAAKEIETLLQEATARLVDEFSSLREAITRVTTGGEAALDVVSRLGRSGPAPMAQMNLPAFAAAPSISEREANTRLASILEALADRAPDARDQLKDWARDQIVAPAYAEAQRKWEEEVRRNYLGAVDAAVAGAQRIASRAHALGTDMAASLTEAAEELAAQREKIASIEVAPSQTEELPVGPEFWETVQGKQGYARSVGDDVASRLRALTGAAEGITEPLRRTMLAQHELQAQLLDQQKALEKNFVEQRDRLASLTGGFDALPLELASFIAVFPMILGLTLGLLIFRRADARREAAHAAAGMEAGSSDDRALRGWLIDRALGGSGLQAAAEATAFGLIASLWVVVATRSLEGAALDMPISAMLAGSLGVAGIVVPSAWDVAAIRRLSVQKQRYS